MKQLLIFMALVFLVLAIICYNNSIKEAYGMNVANIQMTVFAAACAIMFVVNSVGAMILSELETMNERNTTSSEHKLTNNNEDPEITVHLPTYPREVITLKDDDPAVFCDICGVRKKKLTKVMVQTKKGLQEKLLCDGCLEANKDKLA